MTRNGPIARLRDLLQAPGHPYVPMNLQFPLIDVPAMARRLDLVAKGARRGKAGEPPPRAVTLDDIEQSVVGTIEDAKTKAHALYIAGLDSYDQRLAELDFRLFASDIEAQARNVEGNYLTVVQEGKADVFLAKNEVRELDRNLTAFRDEHRITHHPAARLPVLLSAGVFFLLLLIESAANGTFLGEAHTFGLLGGIFEALLVAFLNTASGFIVGWKVIPYLRYRYISRRLLAVLVVIGYIAAVLTLNLAFAHYREALVANLADDAGRLAFDRLMMNPLGVVDLKSWMLFALGIVFSLGALVDGYYVDDPYPGYGRLYRRYTEAVEHYIDLKRSYYERLKDARDEFSSELETAKQTLIGRQSELVTVVAARRRLGSAFRENLNALETAGRELLAIYREANRQARSETGQPHAPAHFASTWALPRPPEESPVEIDQNAVRGVVDDAIASLSTNVGAIHSAYEAAIHEFADLDAIVTE